MTTRFVGIGDLHLDGKLSPHIPNFNRFVLSEVLKVINYAIRNGINKAIFYGDICDKASMTDEAKAMLIELVAAYPDIEMIFFPGNHDTKAEGNNSLFVLGTALRAMHAGGYKSRVIDTPTVIWEDEGPVKVLPWPYFQVDKSCLNVIHVETHGAQWDHGRAVESTFNTSAYCVGGHLHTNQVVGPKKNIHYSGTLYQTNFGERRRKFFHDVTWDGSSPPKVVSVPTTPAVTLRKVTISGPEDFDKVSDDPGVLHKVVLRNGCGLTADELKSRPNVVDVKTVNNAADLIEALSNDMFLPDNATAETFMEACEQYFLRARSNPQVVNRARDILSQFLETAQTEKV